MTTTIDTLTLAKGGHDSIDSGACLLEAASFVAGEEWSDHPACVSPILGAYGRNINDVLPDGKRQQLKPLIRSLIGTAGDGHDQTRGLMAADWLIRVYTPTWLRLAGLVDQAEALEALPRQATWDDVEAAAPTVRAAKAKAAAARAAAWDAAGDAAWAAAWDAAWAAARDAARDALQPTVDQLQDSAIALYVAMINPTEEHTA